MSESFHVNAVDFSSIYNSLHRSGSRVIALVCQATEAHRFMKGALAAGIGGEGFLWSFGSSITSSFWSGDAELVANPALRLRLLKGMFGLTPSTGEGTAPYSAYLARRRQLPSTQGDGVTCNLETDDDGTYLWCVAA